VPLGAAGDPKGVIHTHASVTSTLESIRMFFQQHNVGLSCDDVYFSFLPLAHIFDR
jgi:long-chain acyl-CoA synthetase